MVAIKKFEQGRTRKAVQKIVFGWQRKKLKELRLTGAYMAVWDWLKDKALEDDRNIEEMPATAGGIRLSLEYMRRVFEEEKDIKMKEIRDACEVDLSEYLNWERREISKFTLEMEQAVEEDRIKRQYGMVRDKLQELSKLGDIKAMDLWAKMTGKHKGEPTKRKSKPIQVVDRYLDSGKAEKKVVRLPVNDRPDSRTPQDDSDEPQGISGIAQGMVAKP